MCVQCLIALVSVLLCITPGRAGPPENATLGSEFLLGLNLGNVNVFPFQGSQFNYTAQEMMNIIEGGVTELASHGGNALRVWFHIDGSRSPTWSAFESPAQPGMATGLPSGALDDLKWLLSTCAKLKVKVLLSLWSHDILGVRRLNPEVNRQRAIHMIQDPEATRAYLDNVLVPLVKSLRASIMDPVTGESYADTLIGYEILNEPEGLSWETRLYHTYMYTATWGTYQLENPQVYDAQPARADDRQSAALLQTDPLTGYKFPVPSSDQLAVYQGLYFLAGQGPSPPPCLSSYQNMTSSTQLSPSNYSLTPVPSGYWFNQIMYWNVIYEFNSELNYLLPMISNCSLQTQDISMSSIQRFINMAAGAIHRSDPKALVTVGPHSVPYMTDAQVLKGNINAFEQNPQDWYSDAALKAAFFDPSSGNTDPDYDPEGFLDFISPHAYPYWGYDDVTFKISPFYNEKSTWQVQKPVLVGEFWNQTSDNDALSANEWYWLKSKGYAGGLAWALFATYEETAADALAHGRQQQPQRTIAKHELADQLLGLISDVAGMLKSSQ